MVAKGEHISLTAYEDELLGVYAANEDLNLEYLAELYKTTNHEFNKNNPYGFGAWLVEKGYLTRIEHRTYSLGGSWGILVEEEN